MCYVRRYVCRLPGAIMKVFGSLAACQGGTVVRLRPAGCCTLLGFSMFACSSKAFLLEQVCTTCSLYMVTVLCRFAYVQVGTPWNEALCFATATMLNRCCYKALLQVCLVTRH